MKKFMAVMMAAALISVSAMLASCTDNNNDGKDSGTNKNTQAVTTEDKKDTSADVGTTAAPDTSDSEADTSASPEQSVADTSAAA